MPTPSSIADLSTTASSNSPAGSESNTSGLVDDYLRAIGAVLRQQYSERPAVASAATVDLSGYYERFIPISGTASISSLGTVSAGVEKILRFQAAATLVHGSSAIILPGSANVTTAAGDSACFKSEGSGTWRCIWYTRADGTPLYIGARTAYTATNTATAVFGADSVGGYTAVDGVYSYRFFLNGIEMARLQYVAGGTARWLVGTDSDWTGTARTLSYTAEAAGRAVVAHNAAATGSAVLARVDNTATNLVDFYYGSGANVGTISTNGTSTSYNTTSDARLKRNVTPLTGAGAVIDRINPCRYEWIATGKPDVGVIAQELQGVVPDAVTQSPIGGLYGVDYSKLVPYLLAEVKSLRQRVASLEAK